MAKISDVSSVDYSNSSLKSADMTFSSSFSSNTNYEETESIIKSALDTLSTIGSRNPEHDTEVDKKLSSENSTPSDTKTGNFSYIARNLQRIDLHSEKNSDNEIIVAQHEKKNCEIEDPRGSSRESADTSFQTRTTNVEKRDKLKLPSKYCLRASRENSVASTGENILPKTSLKSKGLKKAWPKMPDGLPTMKVPNLPQSRRSTPRTITRIHTPRNGNKIRNDETSYDQHNALHGNEITPRGRDVAIPSRQRTDDPHCDSRTGNNRDNNSNKNPGPSGVVQLTFEGSYSCRLLRKEKNVGMKVHKELKKREKEVGAPKIITLVSGRGISRESTSTLTSKMRSRKNSIVDFFHKRLSVDKLGQKRTKLSESNSDVVGDVTPTKKVELYLPVSDETFGDEKTDGALYDFESNFRDDENANPGETCENKLVGSLSAEPTNLADEDDCCTEGSVATDATYNMLQHSNIKKRIEELERLKRNKRKKSKALETVTINMKTDSSDDADISAEKTYKKMVPRVKRLSKKILPIVSSKQCDRNLKKIPVPDEIKSFSSSGCEFVTADTHSSRVQSRGLQVSGTIASRYERYEVSEDSKEDDIVAWTDEHGNKCEVEKANGKYGSIKCHGSSRNDTTIQTDPLSPQSVRKRQDASAQVWEPLVSSAMSHRSSLNPPKCWPNQQTQSKGIILCTDGLGKIMRFPLKV